jgi:hypothetical protein
VIKDEDNLFSRGDSNGFHLHCRCASEPDNQSQNFFEFKAAAKKKNSADVFALCTDIGKDRDISTCLNSDGMRSWGLKLASILVAHLAPLGFVQEALCYPLAECIYSLYIVSEPCF